MSKDLDGCVPCRGDNELYLDKFRLTSEYWLCACECLSLHQPFFMFCMNLCIRHHATSFVCLYLVGCGKRQRLGESCRETLQGLERMLIKASYSTASSFLTVPAAGSTTLCFLTTSSPLSLSALLYFCLLPRLCLTCFLSLGLPPAIRKLKQQMFLRWVDGDVTACMNVDCFSKFKI